MSKKKAKPHPPFDLSPSGGLGPVESSAAPEVSSKTELTMWEGRKLMMLLPIYRTFSADTHFSLFANYAQYGPSKIGMLMEKQTLIHEARNILVDRFMKTDADTAIFCDDDMILPCGSAGLFQSRWGGGLTDRQGSVWAISRLMGHQEEAGIVGALYFGRNRIGKAQCSIGFTKPDEAARFRDGTLEALVRDEWVGTGLMRIKRWVLDKMKAEIDNGRWPECKPQGQGGYYGYFTPQGTRIGEDVSFCRRAREIGIQSYVDAGLVCLHAGEMFYGPGNTNG